MDQVEFDKILGEIRQAVHDFEEWMGRRAEIVAGLQASKGLYRKFHKSGGLTEGQRQELSALVLEIDGILPEYPEASPS